MAKLKKTASKKSTAGKASSKPEMEHLSKTISESAQQVWLAGVGAFTRAQTEGTKLFEGLVKDGLNLEQHMRKFAGGRAEVVRDAVENRVGLARDRATDTWDKLEKVFEDRVQRALVKLGVPGRDDLNELTNKVEGLTAELRRQSGAAPVARKTAAKKAPAKAARKPAAKKAPAKRGRKAKVDGTAEG